MVVEQAALGPARERMLQAAERVVADIGAARPTLDSVAQAAGVSKGGLLYHFPSKESLLVALAQRYVDSMQHCIESAKGGHTADRLAHFGGRQPGRACDQQLRELLDVRRGFYQAQIDLVAAQRDALLNTVDLALAVGGGLGERAEPLSMRR